MARGLLEPRSIKWTTHQRNQMLSSLTERMRRCHGYQIIAVVGIHLGVIGGLMVFADWYRSRIPISVELSPSGEDLPSHDTQALVLTLINTGSEPITVIGFEERLCGKDFCFQVTPPDVRNATLQPGGKMSLGAVAHRRTTEKGAYTGLGAIIYVNHQGMCRAMEIPVTVVWSQ